MNEIWKSIEGYEGLYEVSNLGRVRSLNYHRTGQIRVLKLQKDGYGYFYVGLSKDSKQNKPKIHKLVAKAFVPGWFEGSVVNHIDHNTENNVYTNLEWTTQKDNTSREKSFGPAIFAKLFTNGIYSKKVLQFTKSGDFIREWPSIHEIERKLPGFNLSNICQCCLGKRKSANGFVWRYK